MSRPAPNIPCTENQRKELEKIAASRTEEARMVERSKAVLGCINHKTIESISEELGVNRGFVFRWRDRFVEQGISGLQDKARSGKPRTYDAVFEQSVLQTLEKEPPNGMSRWDGGALAKELNASDDAVWRVLRKHGISPQRQRTWCVSTDPNFAAKAADIVGLYISPPDKAIVISIDEKPTIQALERKTGYVTTRDKKVVRGLNSTYKRHGTINLFAALEVASGSIRGKTSQSKKRADFIAFLDSVVTDYPKDRELHVIVDNHSIHKGLNNWLEENVNVHIHYTPTSASWLNMVEIWFGIFTRKVLKGASFSSLDELVSKIMDYIKYYPEVAHPFVWRKRDVTGSQIRNTLYNLCN